IAQIVPDTLAEGPGHRLAVWVQGCALRCPGCCNPHMLGFRGGMPWTVEGLAELVAGTPSIEGISILGGEPFAQAAGIAELCRPARALGKSTMVLRGYALNELRAMADADVERLLNAIDLLVDGPYVRELPETKRRWIGSSNQVMHFLSDRYSPEDPRFVAPNT